MTETRSQPSGGSRTGFYISDAGQVLAEEAVLELPAGGGGTGRPPQPRPPSITVPPGGLGTR